MDVFENRNWTIAPNFYDYDPREVWIKCDAKIAESKQNPAQVMIELTKVEVRKAFAEGFIIEQVVDYGKTEQTSEYKALLIFKKPKLKGA